MTILTESNIFYYVLLTLAEKATPANTISVYIGNREIQNTTTPVYVALKEVSGIGNEVSGNIPALSAGRIVIDNTPGLFGGNRRFSDILEKYAIVNQDVKVYYNALYVQDYNLNALSGATLLWQDLIYNCSFDERLCTLSLRSDIISNKTVNYKIPSGLTATQLDSSIGKVLPLILGSNQYVKPIPIDNSTTAIPRAYYGTSFSNQFQTDTAAPTILLRTRHGYYAEVADPASNFTVIVGGLTGGGTQRALPNALGGQCLEVAFGSSGYLFSHCTLEVYKDAAGSADETVQIGIWSKHPNKNKPDKLLTSGGTIVASDLSTGFNAPIKIFDPPFFCEPNSTYYFGFFTDQQEDGTVNRLKYYHNTVTYTTKQYKIESGTGERLGVWKSSQQSPNRNYGMAFYAVKFQTSGYDSANNSDGLRARGIGIQSNYGWANDNIWSSIDMVIKTNGIKDDGSGTITGTASSVISQPQHIAKLLSLNWNGSTWTGGNFDTSTYSNTHTSHSSTGANYYRVVGGVTTGSVQRNRLLAAIGQELQVFFPRVNATNNFAMYSLGVGYSPSAQITDKDIISLRALFGDRSGVVTIAKASYYKDLTRPDFISTISQGGENNYSLFTELRHDDGGLGQAISANSYTLYGENELAKKTFDYISDATSMRNTLKVVLGINQHPPVFVEVEVPLIKFVALKLYDVVNLTTPQLPMFEGANTRHAAPVYNTNEQVLADTDDETFLGYSYKAQIVSLRYDLMQSALPILNMRLRLLLNGADPT